MNEFTIVFRKTLGRHYWRIKRTSDNVVIAKQPAPGSATMNECVADLKVFLTWRNSIG